MRDFFGAFLVVVLGWIGLVLGQVGNPTLSSQWVADAYQKKHAIAQKIKGKKVVIVAGSNALFGIDSGMLERYFHLPVLNDGVNAGIELPLILEEAKEVIHEGDIVLAPLAYAMYFYHGDPGVQMVDYLLSRRPQYFWRLTLREQFYILWHLSWRRLWEGYQAQGGVAITSGVYGVHHIDNRGDQTHTQKRYQEPYMYERLKTFAKNPEKLTPIFDKDALGWSYIDEFAKWCHQHQVRLIFLPPTQMDHPLYHQAPESSIYLQIPQWIRTKGEQYIGNPYDYMYPSSYYFNTQFHLTDAGRKVRTEQLIDDFFNRK